MCPLMNEFDTVQMTATALWSLCQKCSSPPQSASRWVIFFFTSVARVSIPSLACSGPYRSQKNDSWVPTALLIFPVTQFAFKINNKRKTRKRRKKKEKKKRQSQSLYQQYAQKTKQNDNKYAYSPKSPACGVNRRNLFVHLLKTPDVCFINHPVAWIKQWQRREKWV